MDVRIKLGPADVLHGSEQEVLTGLPDGSLRTLFDTLLARHPELSAAVQDDQLDLALMQILVNEEPLREATLGSYCLKDGDTVRLELRAEPDDATDATSS